MKFMHTDIEGKIRSLVISERNWLLPVFEAVVNSIQSIRESRREDGYVVVTVLRQPQLNVFEDEAALPPIEGFQIEDNGIGFDDKNFKSFNTAYSRHKFEIGGKGVGRFTWLVVFDSAEVSSYFSQGDKNLHREFRFVPTSEGVVDRPLREVDGANRGTKLVIRGVKNKYRNKYPKRTESIANRIIEHCLGFFVLGDCPSIVLHDPATNTLLDLNEMFKSTFLRSVDQESIEVLGQRFNLWHLHVDPVEDHSHRLVYCGDARTVRTEKLGVAKDLQVIKDVNAGYSWVYACYISGDFLDKSLSEDRTTFGIPQEPDLFHEGILDWATLSREVSKRAEEHLLSHLQPLREDNVRRISDLVCTKLYMYRPLIKFRPDLIESLPIMSSEERIEAELHRLYIQFKEDLRNQQNALMKPRAKETLSKQHERLQKFIREYSETETARLADCVSHRKAAVELLEAAISRRFGEKFDREEVIHSLIFPMKITSDDIEPGNHNLWIIDERLASHSYLASDVPFSKMKDYVEVDGAERPDLIIFRVGHAFGEGFDRDSISIVEFKKAGLPFLPKDDNPIDRFMSYVEKLKDGQYRDHLGRKVAVEKNARFYCYLIADLEEEDCRMLGHRGFIRMPEGNGYFMFNADYRTYIEVIDFQKLLKDVKTRHRAFFEALEGK